MSSLIDQSSLYSGKSGSSSKHLTEADKDLQEIDTQERNFLKLMFTTIQHQDPTNPTDPKDMVQSMNSFMQVKQGVRMERKLHEINKSLKTSSVLTQAAALKGLDVFFEGGDSVYLNKGEEAVIRYELPKDVKKIELSIFNKNNQLVYFNQDLKKVAGINEFKWNGKGTDNILKDVGVYRFAITARGRDNENIPIKTYGVGPVTQIWNDSKNEKELYVNGQKVSNDRLQGFNISHKKPELLSDNIINQGNLTEATARDLLKAVEATKQASHNNNV